ncbi:MAG: 2-oxo acid dehydrogenase subunit E2 [Planctomycetes bacterium]|nr:2-oxo acid dehydrogenase subunit E2 [Planctomycetota bacterium]
MAYDFKFPDIGEGVTEGIVVEWKVKEGDMVELDQDLVEIETDKAIVTIPSPRKGVILKIHYKAGETIPVGETLVSIGEKGEKGEKIEAVGEAPAYTGSVVGFLEEAPEEGEEVKPAAREAAEAAAPAGKALATPAVRRLARELGVDVSHIKGTGKDGRVTAEDVKNSAAKAAVPSPKAKKEEKPAIKKIKKYDMYGYITRVPLKGVRKTVARKMAEATSSAALVTHHDDADVTHLVEVREGHKQYAEGKGVKLTYIPFVVKTVIEGLKKYPYLNSTLEEEDGGKYVVLKKYFNIGVAVDTPDGVMVPVVKGADQKTVLDIAKETSGLAKRARERKVDLADMRGGSFTVTNVGFIGGTHFTPIPNHPEVAILGLGRIEEKPVVREGKVVVRRIMPLSLTFDHRVVDGADAARFVNTVKEYLEDPDLFLVGLGE